MTSLNTRLSERGDMSCRLFIGQHGVDHWCLAAAFIMRPGIVIDQLWSFFAIDTTMLNFVLVPSYPEDRVQQLLHMGQCISILQDREVSWLQRVYGQWQFPWRSLYSQQLLSLDGEQAYETAERLFSVNK